MPNHVSHRLTFTEVPGTKVDRYDFACGKIKLLKAMVTTAAHDFDFSVFIPYPEEYAKLDKARHDAEAAGEKDWSKLPKDGYNQGGYEWCIKHWGTKWNGYEVVWDDDCVFFCTAWNTARPIWVEVSKRFPDAVMQIEYADEDIGRNCGILRFQAGLLIDEISDRGGRWVPEYLARAIVAEQRASEHWRDYRETQKKLDALLKEKADAKVTDG